MNSLGIRIVRTERGELEMKRHRRGFVACAMAAAMTIATIGIGEPARAHGRSDPPRVLADELVGPLSIDVGHRGHVLVSQAFAGTISRVGRHGRVRDLLNEPGVSAVGWYGSKVVYTVAGEDGSSLLKLRRNDGTTEVIADLGAHEAAENPDQATMYGFESITPECAEEWAAVESDFGPATYSGIVESNPYSIAVTKTGVYVADAAANAIWFATWNGDVSTVAVLPPQAATVPQDFAEESGIPSCGGLNFLFEPVPTDVEQHRGRLYVSLLPGGPEDASFGARGAVYKVNPWNGRSRQIAGGLAGATDLAVSPHGKVYVTELFGQRVSKITDHGTRKVADLPDPAAIEWHHGRLYVSYDVFGNGTIGTIDLS